MATPYPGHLFSSALEKYAKLLVDYSGRVEKGDDVLIRGDITALPLLREIYRIVLLRGAYPSLLVSDAVIGEIYFYYASPEQLEHITPIERTVFEEYDVHINIMAPDHVKPLNSIDPYKLSIKARATKEIREKFFQEAAQGRRKWTVAPYPTLAMAQEAEMSPMEYEEFVYRAVKLHYDDPIGAWREQGARQERVIREILGKADELRVVGPGIDLTVKVGGRRWISDDGHENMPGGEVFTGPVEDGVEGCVKFDYPAPYMGRVVDGIKLCFRNGMVVEYDAVQGRDLLEKLLSLDEGARRLGEFAFGLNYDIRRVTKNILFDEKIGGTIHMALGQSYPETGGKNRSAIHWDIVKDMRSPDAKVYADGELVYIGGKFRGWED